MPLQKNPIPVPFPIGGINESAAYAGKSGAVITRSDHVLNMRPYDALETRERGGQRTGISKYLAAAVNGSSPIQNINSVVEAFDPNSIVASELLFERHFDDDFGSDGAITDQDPGIWTPYTDFYASNSDGTTCEINIGSSPGGNERGCYLLDACANSSGTAVYSGPAITLGDKYIITSRCQAIRLAGVAQPEPIQWRLDAASRNGFFLRVRSTGSSFFVEPKRLDSGVVVTLTVDTGSTTFVPLDIDDPHVYSIEVNGNMFTCRVNGSVIWTITDTTYASNSDVGFGVYETSGGDGTVTTFKIQKGLVPASRRTTKLVVVSGGNIVVGDKINGLSVPVGGTAAQKTAGIISSAAAFQDLFFCDGLAANYNYLDLGTNTVKDWATDITAGSLPAGSADTTIGCRIISDYRGRIIMSGLPEEPENWFMSVAGDPFDWDYSPAITSGTQAVAGNASEVGELGDIVTALIPHQDDLLFMGGDHTLWVMRGDPAAGGAIDNISRQIGVVGEHAWTWDTGSTLYFIGQNGLYRLAPGGGPPELLSTKKMDRVFAALDFQTNTVFLVYDREWQGVHIFITPLDQPATGGDHYWWDKRTNSFWRDQYPAVQGPTFIHLFDADLKDDRAVLLGGYDSFLRSFDDTTNNDDGTLIDSFVRFPIIHPAIPQGQFQMDDLQMDLDSGGGAATALDIYRGHTPKEVAVSTTSIFNKTLAAGRNLPIRKRLRGNSLQYRLRNNTLGESWAYEEGTVMISGVGRQRAGL